MIDLHVHTSRCGHATGSVWDYVASAAEKGVGVIAITDHLPLPEEVMEADPAAAAYAMPLGELEEYVAEVVEARARSASEGGPKVLLGIEADHIPGYEDRTAELLARYEFDLVIGSVHMIDGWTFDDPDRMERYAEVDIDDLWEHYFRLVADAVASGLFDVIGHLDLVKKFGFRPRIDPTACYESVATALAEHGVCFEVNTAGLRKPCAEMYPSGELLGVLHAHGVGVTIGSDAHTPAEVGFAYVDAVRALRAAGYASAVAFERRHAIGVGL